MWTDRRNLKKLKEVQERIRTLEEATSIEDYTPSAKVKTLWMKDFHWALSIGLFPMVLLLILQASLLSLLARMIPNLPTTSRHQENIAQSYLPK